MASTSTAKQARMWAFSLMVLVCNQKGSRRAPEWQETAMVSRPLPRRPWSREEIGRWAHFQGSEATTKSQDANTQCRTTKPVVLSPAAPVPTTAASLATQLQVDKAKANSLLKSKIQMSSSKTTSSRQRSHLPMGAKDRPSRSCLSVLPLQSLLRTQAAPKTILFQLQISTRTTLSRSSRTRLLEASARCREELAQQGLTATMGRAMALEERQDSEDLARGRTAREVHSWARAGRWKDRLQAGSRAPAVARSRQGMSRKRSKRINRPSSSHYSRVSKSIGCSSSTTDSSTSKTWTRATKIWTTAWRRPTPAIQMTAARTQAG